MKTALRCPCGAFIRGSDEDDLLKKVREHLAAEHPKLDYTDGEILFLAS